MVLSLFVWGRGFCPVQAGRSPVQAGRSPAATRSSKKDVGLTSFWNGAQQSFRHRDSKCSSVLNMPAEADMRCSTRYTGKLALMTIQENVPLAPLTTLQVGGT